MKKIALLGSTGSIGTQTLELVRDNPDLGIASLAARRNIGLLEAQMREFRPEITAVYEEDAAKELRSRTRDLGIPVLSGMEGLIEAALVPSAALTETAVVGMIGLQPTFAAIEAGKDIALANKETLVTAGHLLMPLVKSQGVHLFPVDSEHSAIFQCLRGEEGNRISRLLLTASGGPFRGYTREQLKSVTREDALRHPNWSMGSKITIDSATMVNKGLEVMEAHWLFSVDYDRIEVVVQPQSVIHSMVEFEDGAVKAQLGTPDMKLPIQYALLYPERRTLQGPRLDFPAMGQIPVSAPDTEVFEALPLAYAAGKAGGNRPTVFNAANERMVREFLAGDCGFTDILDGIKKALSEVPYKEAGSISEILETEQMTYEVLNCQK